MVATYCNITLVDLVDDDIPPIIFEVCRGFLNFDDELEEQSKNETYVPDLAIFPKESYNNKKAYSCEKDCANEHYTLGMAL